MLFQVFSSKLEDICKILQKNNDYIQSLIENYKKLQTIIHYNQKRDIKALEETISLNKSQIFNSLIAIDTPKNGNCFFQSVSYALCRTFDNYDDIKLLCIYEIWKNVEFFQSQVAWNFIETNDSGVLGLIRLIAKEYEYGNEGALYALSIALQKEIIWIQNTFQDTDRSELEATKIIPLHKPTNDCRPDNPLILFLSNPGESDAHYSTVMHKRNSNLRWNEQHMNVIDLNTMSLFPI